MTQSHPVKGGAKSDEFFKTVNRIHNLIIAFLPYPVNTTGYNVEESLVVTICPMWHSV